MFKKLFLVLAMVFMTVNFYSAANAEESNFKWEAEYHPYDKDSRVLRCPNMDVLIYHGLGRPIRDLPQELYNMRPSFEFFKSIITEYPEAWIVIFGNFDGCDVFIDSIMSRIPELKEREEFRDKYSGGPYHTVRGYEPAKSPLDEWEF